MSFLISLLLFPSHSWRSHGQGQGRWPSFLDILHNLLRTLSFYLSHCFYLSLLHILFNLTHLPWYLTSNECLMTFWSRWSSRYVQLSRIVHSKAYYYEVPLVLLLYYSFTAYLSFLCCYYILSGLTIVHLWISLTVPSNRLWKWRRRRRRLKQKCPLQNERSHLVNSFYYAWNCTEMRGRQLLRHSVPRTNRFPTDWRRKKPLRLE